MPFEEGGEGGAEHPCGEAGGGGNGQHAGRGALFVQRLTRRLQRLQKGGDPLQIGGARGGELQRAGGAAEQARAKFGLQRRDLLADLVAGQAQPSPRGREAALLRRRAEGREIFQSTVSHCLQSKDECLEYMT